MEKEFLECYQRAVNQIDDYFEYSMDSKVDQARVHEILEDLKDKLEQIQGEENEKY